MCDDSRVSRFPPGGLVAVLLHNVPSNDEALDFRGSLKEKKIGGVRNSNADDKTRNLAEYRYLCSRKSRISLPAGLRIFNKE